MLIITLKITLAFTLTAIPAFYHVWIKPKQGKSVVWGSLFSLLCSAAPKIYTLKRRVIFNILRFHKRMKFSENARKFFTLLLFMMLLIVQAVDYLASIEAQEIHNKLLMQDIKPVYQTTCCIDSISIILGDCCYPYSTPIWLLVCVFVCTIALLNYRFVNYILLCLRSDKKLFIIWSFFTVSYAIVDSGRYLIVVEWLFTLSLASTYFYPEKLMARDSD